MPFSVPLWALLTGQCILTIIIFVVILVSFTVEMESSIEDQVLLRLRDRIDNVRLTLLKPFVEGYNTLSTLSVMCTAEPNKFIPSDNESNAQEVEFYRYGGSAMQNSPTTGFVGQVYESRNAPLAPDGFPYQTTELASKGYDSKVYGNRNNYFYQQAYTVNNSVYRQQAMTYRGPFVNGNEAIVNARLNDTINRNYWTNYPLAFTVNTPTTVINTTTGLPQTIMVPVKSYIKIAMYSTIVGQMGKGLKFYNNWMLMTSVTMTTIEPLLLSLTDKAKGEKDSYAALYDLGAASPSGYKIMAVSHPNEITVVDSNASQAYLPAGQSSSAKMNAWYADALALSLQAGSEEGSVRTKDGRFLSFAHIRHAASNLHLFAVVSTAEHKYFAEVRQLQAVMIAIGVCCGALVVGLGLLIIYFVSVPIRGLKEGMGLAATLQNEKVVPTRSFLSEINSLCVAFAKMNAMLTEAKAYMPASMLVRFSSDDDTAGDDDDEDAANSRREVSILKSSVHTSNSASRKTDWHYDSTDHATTAVTKQIASEVLSHSTLRNRRVAVLAVNVRGFTALPDFAITTVGGHSTTLLDLITVAAGAERGVIDSFHGDHFVLSFNAVKPVGSPGRRAVQCAAAIHQALAGTPYERLSMGASCGTAVVGSLGNLTQRRLSIIGGCYTKALRLQRAAASLERSVEPLFGGPERAPANCFHCLIDAPTQAECSETYNSMLIGSLPEATKRGKSSFVELSRGQATLHNVYAVVMNDGSTRVKNDGDEWMYEMHQKSLKNPYRCVNEAMDGALHTGSAAALKAARDRHAQLVPEASRHGGAAAMASTLSVVIAQLEQCGSYIQPANKAPAVRFLRPGDLKIDFASLEKDGQPSIVGDGALASLCPKNAAGKSASIAILEDPSSATTPTYQTMSFSNADIETPRAERADGGVLSKTDLAELAGWLRIAFVASLVRGGTEDDLAAAVTFG